MASKYNNFVRPSSPVMSSAPSISITPHNGEIEKKLYLEEVKEVREYVPATDEDGVLASKSNLLITNRQRNIPSIEISDKDLFLSIQNNEVETLRMVLDKYPDKINMQDQFGWSLLMIACQANSTESARELLKRNTDITVRDKAGNSAQSLVIKNKNLALAELLLSFKSKSTETESKSNQVAQYNNEKHMKVKRKEEFMCEICNRTYSDRLNHLSSTLHNINASKGKKIPPCFKIPQTNRGYQLMVKVGWDRESGLGPEGSGRKYPIKTVQKKDRKGIGLEKKKEKQIEHVKESVRQINRSTIAKENYRNRRLEADFRRQFY